MRWKQSMFFFKGCVLVGTKNLMSKIECQNQKAIYSDLKKVSDFKIAELS